jgi:hypothetical protein
MSKGIAVEIGCDSFDKHDLQLLNNCKFVILVEHLKF